LYVTDPAACELIEKGGVDAWNELGFLAMSFADGIQSMEFHCNFYEVLTREGFDDVLVEAICEIPGLKYPDLISIAPWDETRIQVGSMYDMQQAQLAASQGAEPTDSEGQGAGITLYTACENLQSLPRN
jgi:hypothetical protein